MPLAFTQEDFLVSPISLPEPFGVTFDCGLVLGFLFSCPETLVPHGCNALWNFMKNPGPKASNYSRLRKCGHRWRTSAWRNTVKNQIILTKSTQCSQRRNIDLTRSITFVMAVFHPGELMVIPEWDPPSLVTRVVCGIADFWCRYQIVTSGKTNWTYADTGPAIWISWLSDKKIPDENKWSICV